MQARDAVLDEGRARRERQQLREDVAERVADGNRPVGAANADVGVDPKAVVPPDDVLEDLVVSPIVRRVDDPLVLPAAPRMRSSTGQTDVEAIGELGELVTALRHALRRLAEVATATGLDLDLGRDQLADQVLVQLTARGSLFQLLEPVRELERLGIEERELLLDCDGEILPGFKRLTSGTDLLLRTELLLVAHVTSVNEGLSRP
jgi:hypothetical protein